VGRTHKWYFGDGTVDSTSVSPVHFYNSAGTFIIKHVIYNVVSNCGDSTTSTITISRVNACLSLSIKVLPDTFFNQKISFQLSYDTAAESGINPLTTPINWNFGNGTTLTDAIYANITYNSAGTYNVCVSAKNRYTGCVSQVCKPVNIVLDSCNADFMITPGLGANRFEGKTLQSNVGILHYWIVNNWDTIRTGNSNILWKDFFKPGTDGYHFNFDSPPSNICGNNTREINLDSLTKTIRHVVVNSISGCLSTVEKSLIVPTRIQNIKITAVPDSEVSDIVTFNASYSYTNSSSNTPYYSRWRMHYTSSSGGYTSYGGDKILMTYTSPGIYNYAVAANSCPGDYTREVYSINYQKSTLDACGVKRPQISYRNVVGNPYRFTFYDTVFNNNEGMQARETIYYGNGDSTNMGLGFLNYTYPQAGVYNYSIKAVSNRTGCTKTSSGIIEVRCPKPFFALQKDSLMPNRISFINTTSQDTSTVAYRWQFGNGDSAYVREPIYTYSQPGIYTVSLQTSFGNGCNFKYDSVIAVSFTNCTPNNLFSDSTHTIICNSDSVDIGAFFNLSGYTVHWNTPNPQKAGLGAYRMLAANSNFCADTAYVKIIQDTAIFTGQFGDNWHNPANWKANRLPGSRSHVIIFSSYRQCVLSDADVTIASLQVLPNRSFLIKNNRRIFLNANCSQLPIVNTQ
jgi:PKD repeat protein